jgi:hypothetical protein
MNFEWKNCSIFNNFCTLGENIKKPTSCTFIHMGAFQPYASRAFQQYLVPSVWQERLWFGKYHHDKQRKINNLPSFIAWNNVVFIMNIYIIIIHKTLPIFFVCIWKPFYIMDLFLTKKQSNFETKFPTLIPTQAILF